MLSWQLIWAAGCYYYIWSWMNKEEHGEKTDRPYDLGEFTFDKVKEYDEVMRSILIGMIRLKLSRTLLGVLRAVIG